MHPQSRRRILLLSCALIFLGVLPWLYLSENLSPLATEESRQFFQPQPDTLQLPRTKPGHSHIHVPKLVLDENESHWNMHQLSQLYACVSGRRKCHPNKRKIVLLASGDTKFGLWLGWRRGESIWSVGDAAPIRVELTACHDVGVKRW